MNKLTMGSMEVFGYFLKDDKLIIYTGDNDSLIYYNWDRVGQDDFVLQEFIESYNLHVDEWGVNTIPKVIKGFTLIAITWDSHKNHLPASNPLLLDRPTT